MVVKNKHRVNGRVEYYFEEEYEPSFNQATNESDHSLLFLGGFAGLIGLTSVLGTLSPTELEEIESTTITGAAASFSIPGIGNISKLMPEANTGLISDAKNLTPNELSHLKQMMEEGRQYSRISDPRTAENITYNNTINRAERIGQFGYHESSVQGNLDLAGKEGILYPWETSGDGNVCSDCQDLEDNGPYPADYYPKAPHYGCRCNEPFPDPVISLSGEAEG
jgi:hypothetical protein